MNCQGSAVELRDALRQAVVVALPMHHDAQRCADHLYQCWYLGLSAEGDSKVGSVVDALHFNLRGALRAAHAASSQWDEGWTVREVAFGGVVTVERNGAIRKCARIDVLPVSGPTLAPRLGHMVAITARRDTDEVPGAWVTYGGAWPEEDQPPDLHRYYVHVQHQSVLTFVHSVTARLEAAGLTYAVKVVTGTGRFVRPDAAVCYSPAAEAHELCALLLDLVDNHDIALTQSTPQLAAILRPGLAWACDPGGNQSFGEWWCNFISAHITLEMQNGIVPDNPVQWLTSRLLDATIDAGVDPSAPHLLISGTSTQPSLAAV